MSRYLGSVLYAKTSTFRYHIPLTPSGALLLTGLRGSGRFYSKSVGKYQFSHHAIIETLCPIRYISKIGGILQSFLSYILITVNDI